MGSVRLPRDKRWTPVLGGPGAAEAVSIALEVATRLSDPETVAAAAAAAAQQTAFPRSAHWQPHGLAQGYAGLAVMAGYLDRCFPDGQWDAVGHRYLSLATRGAEEAHERMPSGLWGGLSGLSFAASYLSREGSRYRRLTASLEQSLLPWVSTLARQLADQTEGVPVFDFDLISGLSGVAAYLLTLDGRDPARHAAQTMVIQSLVQLSRVDDGLPRWRTPAQFVGDETMQRLYPHGNINCGLAHGGPGLLAALAIAQLRGVQVDGLVPAIERVGGWLASNRYDDAWGVNWPDAVPLQPDTSQPGHFRPGTAAATPRGPSRSAWCYGAPGVCRALWLAGEALDALEFRDLALAGIEAVHRRPAAQRLLESPTFCHGLAGLLQTTLRFAHETRMSFFVEAAGDVIQQTLDQFDDTSRLGYHALEPGGGKVDHPGLLDGASGIVLVLLAATGECEPEWDCLFLLT